jgi:hypothetical protein
MSKSLAVVFAVLAAFLFSGCVLVSSHTAASDDGTGTKTAVGLFGFGAIDNGYPLIPFYSHYEQTPANGKTR